MTLIAFMITSVKYHLKLLSAKFLLLMISMQITVYIIVIKKGWQCKTGRERLTPYQSEDPNPTTPTHRMKEDKWKTAGGKK